MRHHYFLIFVLLMGSILNGDNAESSGIYKPVVSPLYQKMLSLSEDGQLKVDKFVFRSDESLDHELHFEINSKDNIFLLLDTTYLAKRYDAIYFSGYVYLDAYSKDKKIFTLTINESDRVLLNDDDKGYRCIGINKLLMDLYQTAKELGKLPKGNDENLYMGMKLLEEVEKDKKIEKDK